jgi:hypothetical protein
LKRYRRDVAQGLRQLLAGHPLFGPWAVSEDVAFRLHSLAVIELLSALASQFPQVSFAARGRGEDLSDIWVRQYSGGEVVYEAGPPEAVIQQTHRITCAAADAARARPDRPAGLHPPR